MPGHRADEQEAEDAQVDVAHAEMAGAGEERQRDGVHDVGTDETPRRQRVVERRQRHDADGAGPDRRQRHEHAEHEPEHERRARAAPSGATEVSAERIA